MGEDDIRVAELFAGVGGFRLGLEGHPDEDEETGFKVVFSNQWEPPPKGSNTPPKQWASMIYEKQFGSEGHTNDSIHDFTHPIDGIKDIAEHDLLVGGFPCQDYSVARTVSGELGIEGEKGKLWVDIARILRWKRPRPKMVFLENVPRLLNSPATARGLNFAIILNDLISMGYEVEWRVINAADYGMPQQRSRVFILAYRTPGKNKKDERGKINGPQKFGFSGQPGKVPKTRNGMTKWLLGKSTTKTSEKWEIGPFAEAFPMTGKLVGKPQVISQDLEDYTSKPSPFGNSGYAWQKQIVRAGPWKNVFWSTKVKAEYEGERTTLGDILEAKFDDDYKIDESRLDEWRYAKGTKNEFRLRKKDRKNVDKALLTRFDLCMNAPHAERRELWQDAAWRKRFEDAVGPNAFYRYDEGAMKFDQLNKPSRTVVTDEIGKTPSRMRHIVEYEEGKFRRLMPVETERLNMFPDNWTAYEKIVGSRRGFLMGNALVVGVVSRLSGPIRYLIRTRSNVD
ncbi:DNA (cytosine-5-)-methyltransferase [Candidatus Poseidonia alphae]|nr:DNA (cytosine-5-)-methyltransferase [Candidatus Poseidonia alphae]